MVIPNSWMIFKGKSHLEMDDLGVPLFMETSIWLCQGSLYGPPRHIHIKIQKACTCSYVGQIHLRMPLQVGVF